MKKWVTVRLCPVEFHTILNGSKMNLGQLSILTDLIFNQDLNLIEMLLKFNLSNNNFSLKHNSNYSWNNCFLQILFRCHAPIKLEMSLKLIRLGQVNS